jgi:hypothetical protein
LDSTIVTAVMDDGSAKGTRVFALWKPQTQGTHRGKDISCSVAEQSSPCVDGASAGTGGATHASAGAGVGAVPPQLCLSPAQEVIPGDANASPIYETVSLSSFVLLCVWSGQGQYSM